MIFSVVDKNSFETAETILKNLREHEMLRLRPAILVGNKVDMARSREVTAQGIHIILNIPNNILNRVRHNIRMDLDQVLLVYEWDEWG